MAKRFIDTKLHRKTWFRKLRGPLREAWRILFAECDEIGVWEIDLESLNMWLGIDDGDPEWVTLEQLNESFEIQIIDDDKVWIPGFVPFQYGDEEGKVSWKNKMTPKIIRMLNARKLPHPIFKDVPEPKSKLSPIYPPSMVDASPIDGVKEQVQEEEKVEGEGGVGETNPPTPEEITQVLKAYPRQEDMSTGTCQAVALLTTRELFTKFAAAVANYAALMVHRESNQQHILLLSTFIEKGRWKDYVERPAELDSPRAAKRGAPAPRIHLDPDTEAWGDWICRALKAGHRWDTVKDALRSDLAVELELLWGGWLILPADQAAREVRKELAALRLGSDTGRVG
jgi:hypothetical protein